MKKNMGSVDRLARFILGVMGVVLIAAGSVTGVISAVVAVFTAALLFTSVVGWCPLYVPFGISTMKKGGQKGN